MEWEIPSTQCYGRFPDLSTTVDKAGEALSTALRQQPRASETPEPERLAPSWPTDEKPISNNLGFVSPLKAIDIRHGDFDKQNSVAGR